MALFQGYGREHRRSTCRFVIGPTSVLTTDGDRFQIYNVFNNTTFSNPGHTLHFRLLPKHRFRFAEHAGSDAADLVTYRTGIRAVPPLRKAAWICTVAVPGATPSGILKSTR